MAIETQPEYLKVKQPGRYRVIAMPATKPKSDYPAIGLEGEVMWTSSWNGVCLDIMGKKFVVPFDCIEEVSAEKSIEDAELIAIMLNNPFGVYKLLRGLWRMTKHPVVRNFMECAELPSSTDKTPEQYNKQWDEVEEASKLENEAAMAGAFSGEFVV